MENERSYLAGLVRQYQNGNQNAFNEIYQIAFGKAYFTALKICKNEDDV